MPTKTTPSRRSRQPLDSLRRLAVIGLAAGLCGPLAFAQPAAEPLDKPVRIIVAYGAGGASDAIARFVADGVARRAGKTAIVENKPGADGNIAAEAAARAPHDSYTLLVSGPSTHAANATIYRKLPYDPEADFTPLATMVSTPFVLLVNPKRIQATSFKDFQAWARQESNPLSFASANVGGRISGELFKQRSGLKAVNVPYKTSSQAMTGPYFSCSWALRPRSLTAPSRKAFCRKSAIFMAKPHGSAAKSP